MSDYLKWNNSDSAKFILEWAEGNYANSLAESIKAEAEEVGRKSKEDFWDTYNPNDGIGGFSQNPYRGDEERNLKRIEKAHEDFHGYEKILAFIRTKICNLIVDEK